MSGVRSKIYPPPDCRNLTGLIQPVRFNERDGNFWTEENLMLPGGTLIKSQELPTLFPPREQSVSFQIDCLSWADVDNVDVSVLGDPVNDAHLSYA